MDQCQCTSLLAFLKVVPDPRHARGKVFPWPFLLAVVCGAVLGGQVSGSAIGAWAAEYWQEVADCLGMELRRGPSHSTLRRALRYVDIEALERRIADYSRALDEAQAVRGRVVGAHGQPLRGAAIDGKDVRGAGAHGVKVHLLSLVLHGSGVTLAQRQVEEKTNEIPAVPELLAGRDLRGIVITVDALNTQRATAQRILERDGDYLMVVKENQPLLYADIEALFAGTFLPQEDDRDTYSYSNKGHGRLETRTLTCSAGLVGYLNWPGAQQVARRQCLRREIRSGKVSNEVTYAVTSLDRARAAAERLETLWRGHWTIENKDHYVRDVTLSEDRCQIHEGNAPRALAALKNALLAALRFVGWANIAEAIRYYGASVRRALALLAGTALCDGPVQAPKGLCRSGSVS